MARREWGGDFAIVYETHEAQSLWRVGRIAVEWFDYEREAMERMRELKDDRGKFQRPVMLRHHDPEDSIVLDPFCGCATTLVAAQDMNRNWIGIDISKKAVDLVKTRFRKELSLHAQKIIERDDIPVRTGVKPSNGIRNILYSLQEGNCNLCGHHFSRKRDFDLDHITPRQHGGPDADENLQLLCGSCNSRKGIRSMATIVAIYKKNGDALNPNPVYIRDLTGSKRKEFGPLIYR